MKKYPKTQRDKWRSVKIPRFEHYNIRGLRKQGYTYKEIAIKYHVHQSTISMIINPKKYKLHLLQTINKNRKKSKEDKEWNKHQLKLHYERIKNQRKNDKKFREWWYDYQKNYIREYYKTHPEYRKKIIRKNSIFKKTPKGKKIQKRYDEKRKNYRYKIG